MPRRCFLALVVLAAATLLCVRLTAQRPALQPRVFAIVGARVILEPGKELPRGTVVIRDGLIAAVGADIKPPADALVIDAAGLIVYPGFIDAGSHWGIDLGLRRSEGGPPEPVDLALEALAATQTDYRKGIYPEFDAATALKADEETADAWRKLGFTFRLAAPDAANIGGRSTLVSLSGAAPRLAVLPAPAPLYFSFTVGGQGYPRSLMGTIAHMRQTLLDAGHHARARAHFAEHQAGPRPPVDPALEALQPVLEGKLPVLFEADTMDGIHRALDFAQEFRLRPIILGGAEAWRAADRLAAQQVPVIVRLNFPDNPRRLTGRRSVFGSFAPIFPNHEGESSEAERVKAERERLHRLEIRNAAALAERQVLFAFSGQGHEKPARFRQNLLKVVDTGLPPEKALAALTIHAAKILGVDRHVGSIAPGKAAHLVVMTGEFLWPDTQVKHLFSDGRHFEYEVAKTPPKPRDKPKAEAAAATPRAGPTGDEVELETDRKPVLQTKGRLLISNATILTVTNGTIQGDLLINGGKIVRLGKNLAAPDDCVRLDGTGLYVMPGIIDTHSHFAISGGVNEFTLSVVPEVRVHDVIDSDDVQIYRGLAGGVTTARLLHGSANVIGGQDAVIKLKYGASAAELLVRDAPRGVKFALGENVKRTDGRFPNTRLGVEAVLVRAFSEAQVYQKTWQDYAEAKASGKPVLEPRRDLRLEALVDVLEGRLHVHCHCYRADEILMLLRVADRFKIKIKSLQHVLEGYKIAAEIAAHGASNSTFSDWWAYKIEAYDATPYNAALLHEAGALVCLKSDSNELMRHLYQEAAKLVKYGGMHENDALKTITYNPALQLGLEHRIGSIAEGMDADLAIFDAHPLDGYAKCVMTLVEGEVYFARPAVSPRWKDYSPPLPPPRVPGVWHLHIPRNVKGLYLLTGATVHPVSGMPLKNVDVLIEAGKIKEIGASLDRKKAAGGTVVLAEGLHVYPGMIDAASIVGLTEIGSARETQDFAEGGDFQPDLRAVVGINPDSELIPVTRANGVLSVVVRPTGPTIAGQSAIVNLAGWVPAEMVLVEPFALHIDFPTANPHFGRDPNAVSLTRAIARHQRESRIRRLKELFRQALAYDAARRSGMGGRIIDPRLEALVPYARGEKPVVVQAQRKEDILAALQFADELKLKMILSGGIDSWKVADELKKRDVPVILGPVMAMPQEATDPYDAPFTCAAKLHAAGVRFCIRSGGGTNTRNLPYEAAMAASYGLDPKAALEAVTFSPAKILGVDHLLGSIEVGKLANLVITDGDLLQPTTQVRALFIKGQPVDPASKHSKAYERYRERLKEIREGKAPLGTK